MTYLEMGFWLGLGGIIASVLFILIVALIVKLITRKEVD